MIKVWINVNKMPFFLMTLYILAAAIFSFFSVSDTDLGFILKTGEYILTNYEIPTSDIFSFSAYGQPWIPHYWLFGVIAYLLVTSTGFSGLSFFMAFLAGLTYFFVIQKYRLYSKDPLIALILIFPLTLYIFNFWSARTKSFSNLFLAVLLFLIEKQRLRPAGWINYAIPALFILWSNFHGGVLIGLAVLGIWVGAALIEEKFSIIRCRTQIFTFIASCGASLINPLGYKSVFYFFFLDSRGVSEFRSILSAVLTPPFPNVWWIMIFMMALTTIFLIYRKLRYFKKSDIFEIALIIAAFTLPLIAIRHIVFFPIIMIPILAKEWLEIRNQNQKIDNAKLYKYAFGIVCALLLIRSAYAFTQPPLNKSYLPVDAVNFIDKEKIAGPMFNDISVGGWLIWRSWPDRRVFIDGRSDVYGEVNDEFRAVMRQDPGWEKIVDKYGFKSFILRYRLVPGQQEKVASLINDLIDQHNFKLIYWDDAVVVLTLDEQDNKDIINKYGYNFIRPFKNPSVLNDQDLRSALAEAEKALQFSPDSVVLKNLMTRIQFEISKRDL